MRTRMKPGAGSLKKGIEEKQEEEDEEAWHTIQPRGDFFRVDRKTATLKIQG